MENKSSLENLNQKDREISENLENLENEVFSSGVKKIESCANSVDNKNSFSEIRKAGEKIVKNFSVEVVRLFKSNKLAIKLRNFYIGRQADQIRGGLGNNSNKIKQEDCQQFLKLLQSDFWGDASDKDDAGFDPYWKSKQTISAIREDFPDLSKEILITWSKLFTKKNFPFHENSTWQETLDGEMYKRMREAQENEEKLDFSDDPFLALNLLKSQKNSIDAIEGEDLANSVLEKFDSIIEKYPSIKNLPRGIFEIVIDIAKEYPEKIMFNKKRQRFLFDIWFRYLNKEYYNRSSLLDLTPIFIDCFSDCSENERSQIEKNIFQNWNNSYSNSSFRWLINILPSTDKDKKDLEKYTKNIKTQIDDIEYWTEFNFKQESLRSNNSFEEKKYLLMKMAERSEKGDNIVFLSYLIINYPHKDEEINEEYLTEILDSLFQNNKKSFNINNLKSLSILMNSYNWPDSLRQKVFASNNVDGYYLNQVFSENREGTSWIKENLLLYKQLELDFYERAQDNDLRHHFYDVLDNKFQANDFDALIKSYANSQRVFNSEEILDLFVKRQVNKDYLPLFVKKVYSDVFSRDLQTAVENNVITSQDRILFLESLISFGNIQSLSSILEELSQEGLLEDGNKKREMAEGFSKNVLKSIENIDPKLLSNDTYNSYQAEIMNFDSILGDEEGVIFLKNIYDGLLSLSNCSGATAIFSKDMNIIKHIYPNETEQIDYLKKMLEKIINSTDSNSSFNYFINKYFLNSNLLNILEPDYLDEIDKQIFDKRINVDTYILLASFEYMSSEQKSSFIESLDKNFKLFESSANKEINGVVSKITDLDFFRENEEPCLILYKKILNDSSVPVDIVNRLLKKQILFNHKDVVDIISKNIDNWPMVNGGLILDIMQLEDGSGKSKMSFDEVKKISSSAMVNNGLSPFFWRNYLASDKENPAFFLDKELFKIGIKKIHKNISGLKGFEVIDFLKSLESDKFKLSDDDRVEIINSIIKINAGSEMMEEFYNYDKKSLEMVLSNYLPSDFNRVKNVFNTKLVLSSDFNNKIIDYISSEDHIHNLEKACIYFKDISNREALQIIKKKVYSLKTEKIEYIKKIFLKLDLLDVQEAKQLYKEITDSSKNIREQIIGSIEIIGSMLSNPENTERIKDFLDSPKPENIENLKEISSFIEKYNKENKGRSIVTMLFAREYLPDRSLEKVLEKVSGYLKKYEKVLEKYSYKNIPEGIKASIGMEYEITSSTAEGYKKLTEQDLKQDIAKLSEAARIGSGKDAVHEIATRPTDNPYLMLLEMKLLHDIEYIDLNFDRSPDYQRGARGFHLTIGGEKGLEVEQNTQFLQNVLIASSWGGIQSGETGHRVNGGRGVSLRNRGAGVSNNIPFFGEKTNSVELRSLSIDKEETLQRAITTAFNGAIAIQAFKKCFKDVPTKILESLDSSSGQKETERQLELSEENDKTKLIAKSWLSLLQDVDKIIKKHNNSFLERETSGYLDEYGIWIDSRDFGGEYNKKRFEAIVENLDKTVSLEEYVNTTSIDRSELFREFNIEFSDKLTKVNNLYLKPGTSAVDEKGNSSTVFKGDHVNAISALETTKLDGGELESYDKEFLRSNIFDMSGERRKGYYCLQGGSKEMLAHAIQRALMKFNLEIEELVN